tara:strand:+ start:1925 stop:4033 length:2109 start_codon:yes stop_codon:yes gene_type:complete
MADILETKIRVKELVNTGADEVVIDEFIKQSGFTIDQIQNFNINTRKGVSFMDRVKLGLAPNYKSKKATVEKMYKGAVPINKGNFAFMNEQGEAQVVNPKGFDVGDIGQYAVSPLINMGANIYGAYKGQKAGSAFGPYGRLTGGILGAGTGEVIGGEIADRTFQAMGGVIERTPKEYITEKAFDFGVGSVSEFASPFLLKALKYPFSGLTKKSKQQTLENLDIFYKANVPPASVSMVIENPLIKDTFSSLEYILGNIPFSRVIISNAGKRMQQDMGKSLVKTSNNLVKYNRYRNISNINAGSIIKDGIDNAVTGFKTESGKLYTKAFESASKEAGDKVKVGANNFISKLDDLATPKGANIYKKVKGELTDEVIGQKPSVLQSKFLINLREEIADKADRGLLTFEELRNYRSLIGKKLTNKSLIDDVSTAEYKQLYGAISEDLKSIYAEIGGDAYKEFLRADKYYKAGLKRIDNVLAKVNKIDEDKVFNYLLNQSKDGSTYIRTIKKSLTNDEFAIIQNRIIQKLGRTKAGKALDLDSADYTDIFNSETFLTNWNQIDSTAKDFLFSSNKYKQLKTDLDYLAKVSEIVRQSGKTFQNPSGTADSIIGQLSYIGAIYGGNAFGFWNTFLTGAYLVGGAKMMTSPKTVRWLAQGTKIAENKGFDGVIKHLGKASVIFAGEDPELQAYVMDFGNSMQDKKEKKEDK